ncbi:sigma-70 family RNA polymerase sigma factor [Planctomycetota bacterium]
MTSSPNSISVRLEDLVSPDSTEGTGHMKAVALRTYHDQKTPPVTDDQITEYLPMVNGIARKVASYLRPPLSFEDLVSAGTIGLLKAARDFDAGHGASFKTYAYIRIKGAILDEMRSASMLPSNLGRQIKVLMEYSQRVVDETGVAPRDDQLAQHMDISIDQVYDLLESARAQRFVSLHATDPEGASLEEAIPATNSESPDQELQRAELVENMTDAIQELDQKRRQIIVLYYKQHLTMRQISELLKITESRVSQLHASALHNLSAKLREWKDGQY